MAEPRRAILDVASPGAPQPRKSPNWTPPSDVARIFVAFAVDERGDRCAPWAATALRLSTPWSCADLALDPAPDLELVQAAMYRATEGRAWARIIQPRQPLAGLAEAIGAPPPAAEGIDVDALVLGWATWFLQLAGELRQVELPAPADWKKVLDPFGGGK